jgi:predicted nucleic acid-binding protein
MTSVVVLDTTPLGLVTQKPGKVSEVVACLSWIGRLTRAGCRIVVPEVADYEVRRELIRAHKIVGLKRLDAFNAARQDRYVPITTEAMLKAADLWARARNAGLSTADPHALDGDVILVAQALGLNVPSGEIIVATNNVRHISRFIAADLWSNIHT